jgi:hypothetical protein
LRHSSRLPHDLHKLESFHMLAQRASSHFA